MGFFFASPIREFPAIWEKIPFFVCRMSTGQVIWMGHVLFSTKIDEDLCDPCRVAGVIWFSVCRIYPFT